MKDFLRYTTEFTLIAEHYGLRKAARSDVPLINHIYEGVHLMEFLGASIPARLAFMLHPLVQDFVELECNMPKICRQEMLNTRALILAMEYRRTANAYLCKPHTDKWGDADVDRAIDRMMPEVRLMLIADKVQNHKDFMMHHYGTHERSKQLKAYFDRWFRLLGVSEKEVTAFTRIMSEYP